MSGWSGIYFRYEVENRARRAEEKILRGLVGNRYKGFEPYHIFVRGTESASAAMGCLLRADNWYGVCDSLINRTLDVDFVCKAVELGDYDACYQDEEDTEDADVSSFFFNDCNYYGGVFIDVKGYINERTEVSEEHPYGEKFEFKVKYAFVDNTYNPSVIMTPEEYVKRFANYFDEDFIGADTRKAINKILDDFRDEGGEDHDELMTMEEVMEFISYASVKKYKQ